MRSRVRLVAGAVIAVGAMSLALLGTLESTMPFLSPAELEAGHEGRRVQVEGLVEDLEPIAGGLSFLIGDGRGAEVAVTYRYGAGRPLALENGRLVIVKGVYREGIIAAQQVSVRAHEGIEPDMTADRRP